MKKFELTTNTRIRFGRILHQIKALVSFGVVRAGELGGYVEKESNLSHDGDAWVFGNAEVSDNARVFGDARVSGDARVFGNARVSGDAWVFGDASVSDNAWVFGNAEVSGDAEVSDNARVSGNARVFGNAEVFGDARVFGNADWMIVGPIGSRNAITTFYRRNDGVIMVVCGCFHGTIDEFEGKVSETHGDNEHATVYRAAVRLVKIRMNRDAV